MTHFLERPHSLPLSYHKTPGKSPGIVFLHGFHSDKDGIKPQYLSAFCQERGIAFYAFDHFGHGASSGDFRDGTIGQWRQDTCDFLDHVVEGPVICVGSSMGGWMAVLAALDRPEKVMGLLGIAAAPDFTTRLLLTNLSAAQQHDLTTQGYFLRPSTYGEPYPITQKLIEESRNHLVMDGPIPLSIPVTLLHGMRDADVPYGESIELAQRITSQSTQVILRKMGDHRLGEPEDLDFMGKCLEDMLGDDRGRESKGPSY